jgi:hypothetical protein
MRKYWIGGVLLLGAAITSCIFDPCIQGYGPLVEEPRQAYGFTGVSNNGSLETRIAQADTFSVRVEAQENLLQFIETFVSGSTLIVKTRDGSCLSPGAPVVVHVTLPLLEAIENNGSGRLIADVGEGVAFDGINTGSGLIRVDSIFTESVFLENTGSGKVEVDGIWAFEAELFQSGSGLLDAGALYGTEEVYIDHISSGRVFGAIIDGFDVDVIFSGSGRVELAGEVEEAGFRLEGSGRIDALDLLADHVKATIEGSGNIYTFAIETLDVVIDGSGDVLYLGTPDINSIINGSGDVRPY